MFRFYYGWVIVGVTFLIGVTEAGAFQNVLSVFLKPMAETFNWSRAAVSGTMAFGSICAGIVSPIFGPILDRHGSRMVAFWGVLILSIGLFCLSSISHLWQLYLFFGVGRIAALGVLTLTITVTVSNWFIRLRGRAMGIAWLGPRIGAAVLPALAQYLILTQGWRFAWGALGIVVFLMSGLPAVIFLRRRPEDIGLLPDGDPAPIKENTVIIQAEDNAAEVADPLSEPIWTRQQAVRTSTFWWLTIITSFHPFINAGINFHLFPFMTDHGIGAVWGIALISTIAVSGAAGAVFIGFLAERFSKRILLSAIGFASGLVFWGFYITVAIGTAQSSGPGVLLFLAVFYGLLHGGRLPLFSLIWAEYFGRESLGSIYSFSSPFRLTANAFGPIFAALFFDITGRYTIPFWIFIFLFMLVGIFSLLVKPPRVPSSKADP